MLIFIIVIFSPWLSCRTVHCLYLYDWPTFFRTSQLPFPIARVLVHFLPICSGIPNINLTFMLVLASIFWVSSFVYHVLAFNSPIRFWFFRLLDTFLDKFPQIFLYLFEFFHIADAILLQSKPIAVNVSFL